MCFPDLIVCRGRYADVLTGALTRSTSFMSSGLLRADDYRRALRFGSTPPHQATLFGPGACSRISHYASRFNLSADLDYFLRISRFDDLVVQCLDLELVHMSLGGISGQQTKRRLKEVSYAYRRAFGWTWFLTFLARYFRRFVSLFSRS